MRSRLRAGACFGNSFLFVLLAFSFGGGAARAQSAGSAYTTVQLPTPSQWAYSYASAINASGQVIGYVESPAGDSHGCIWDPTTGFMVLDDAADTQSSYVNGINSLGQVLGEIQEGNGDVHLYLWSRSGGFTTLSQMADFQGGWPVALNDQGQFVGSYSYGSLGLHAFLWSQSAGFQDLGILPSGSDYAEANAVNNSGQAVGFAEDLFGQTQGVIWDPSTGIYEIGGPAGDIESRATAINDQGQVIGDGMTDAFFWSKSTGVISFTSYPSYDSCYAGGLNNLGQVVGGFNKNYINHTAPFLWSQSTGYIYLNLNGWPTGISDAGQIIFEGNDNQAYTAYPFTLTSAPAQLNPGKSGTLQIAVPFPVTANTLVPLTSNVTTGAVPASLTIPKGKTSVKFTLNTTGVPANSVIRIGSTYRGWKFTTSVTVAGALSSLSVASSRLVAGGTAPATVTLQAPAAGDTVVTLASNRPAMIVPASVTIPAGSSTATFPITADIALTAGVTATVKATCGGVSQSVSISAVPESIRSLSLSPGNLTGNMFVTGTVSLTYPAPVDFPVKLTHPQDNSIFCPAQATVPAGSSSGTFYIQTASVAAADSVTITGVAPNQSTASAALTVQPAVAFQIALSPWSVYSGQTSTLSVSLSAPAPTGGLTFALTSGAPGTAAFTSSTLSVPAGQTTGTASLTTGAVSTETQVPVSATLGLVSHNLRLTVVPNRVASLTFSPASVRGGQSSTGTITLVAPAAAPILVSLSSGDASVTVPATVKVPAGATTATFTAKTTTVSTRKTVALSASIGSTVKHGTLTLTPAR
jgi:hypothetical protein